MHIGLRSRFGGDDGNFRVPLGDFPCRQLTTGDRPDRLRSLPIARVQAGFEERESSALLQVLIGKVRNRMFEQGQRPLRKPHPILDPAQNFRPRCIASKRQLLGATQVTLEIVLIGVFEHPPEEAFFDVIPLRTIFQPRPKDCVLDIDLTLEFECQHARGTAESAEGCLGKFPSQQRDAFRDSFLANKNWT
jgi:hypothetical protein